MRAHRIRSIDEIIERQLFQWRQAAKATQETPEVQPPVRPRPAFGPYITLSREYGGRALEVAEKLSARLDWTVYDREIVDAVAREAKVRQSVVESLDERTQAWVAEYLAGVFFLKIFTGVDYLHHLALVVTTIARFGKAILVGRGANFILPPEFGVRVRLVAPLEQRVRWIARRHQILTREALDRVQREDRQREAFVRSHFGRDIADPRAYDLVIAVSEDDLDDAVETILVEVQRKLGVRVSQPWITRKPEPAAAGTGAQAIR